MELSEALGARRSCRDFRPDPIAPETLERVLAAALRAPTAGNSWGLDLVVLDEPGRYWDVTLPAGPRRDAFPWPGLLRAPVLIVPVVRPAAYVERYAEADKRRTGLGDDVAAWAVPYWWVDAGAAVMAMLLAAADEGLGSLLFGQFGHEAAVASLLRLPPDRQAVGTVAVGYPAPGGARSSRSAARGRPPLDGVTHRGGW